MRMHRFAIACGLSTIAIFALDAAASAYPAAATTALNVRSGPGTQFGVMAVLQRDQVVEVLECTGNGWCEVESQTYSGWASSRYLSRLEEDAPPSPSQPQPQPLPDPEIEFPIETPDFGFSVGTGERPGYRPPSSGQVCFYDADDFSGREFCVGSGDMDLYLAPVWNDVIRSISISGSVEVTVCTGTGLSGQCATLNQSTRSLGELTGAISSYQVDRF